MRQFLAKKKFKTCRKVVTDTPGFSSVRYSFHTEGKTREICARLQCGYLCERATGTTGSAIPKRLSKCGAATRVAKQPQGTATARGAGEGGSPALPHKPRLAVAQARLFQTVYTVTSASQSKTP